MKKSLNVLIGLIFVLIVWGGVVRVSGSGLGCPDWPLCHGQAVPPGILIAWIEYIHRLLAAAVGILTLWVVIAVWRSADARSDVGWLGALALVLLLAQSGLGGLAVYSELSPHIIASHMGLALWFLGVIITIKMRLSSGGSAASGSTSMAALGWIAVIAVGVQSFLGATVSASHAGLACPDFPTCLGQWWPPMFSTVTIHMIHRMGALVALLLIGAFCWATMRRPALQAAHKSARVVLMILGLQILLGIGNVLMRLPMAMDLAHLFFATALFVMVLVLSFRVRRCVPTSN